MSTTRETAERAECMSCGRNVPVDCITETSVNGLDVEACQPCRGQSRACDCVDCADARGEHVE